MVVIFKYVYKTVVFDHSNEKFRALLSCATLLNILKSVDKAHHVQPFKRKLLGSTFRTAVGYSYVYSTG